MPKTVEPFRAAIRTEAIRFLLPFICREETRYYLNGVHLEAHRDGGVLAVATDGHKMGVAYDDIGAAEGLPDNVIVRVVPEIERDLKGAFEDSVPHRDMVRWLVVDQEMARVVVAGSAAAALEQPVLSSATKGFAHGTPAASRDARSAARHCARGATIRSCASGPASTIARAATAASAATAHAILASTSRRDGATRSLSQSRRAAVWTADRHRTCATVGDRND